MTLSAITIGALTLMSSIATTDLNREPASQSAVIASCHSPSVIGGFFNQTLADTGSNEIDTGYSETGLIKLVESGDKFDLWLESKSGIRLWSAQNSGARITSLSPDGNSHHLMLYRENGQIEHFLFNIEVDGSGELIWSSAERSALTTCRV